MLLFTARRTNDLNGTVPIRQDSDTGGHISTEPRINDRIRVPEVRLVGPTGEQVGIVSINDALRLAQEADLDLVEVAPTARPPVCRLMDYGKFKYESALKARESRKNQAQTVIKEIKIRPKIDPHDYGTKKGHVERFLRQGDKVKVTIMFRGREQSRPELGYKLLQRLAGDVEELGFVESQPKQDGRNMIMVIGPHRKKAEAKAVRTPERASARAAAPASASRAEGEDDSLAVESAPRAAAPARTPRPPASSSISSGQPADGEPGVRSAADTSSAEDGSLAGSTSAGSTSAGSTGAGEGVAQDGVAAAARPAASRTAAPKPAPPKPGPVGGAARPAPVGGAPKPASAASAAKPGPAGAAKPAPPKPGPAGGPKPAPPKPSATRPAPRPAAKPGDQQAVPRARPAERGAAGGQAGG